MIGLVPLVFTTATGREVQRPLATVVVGGLITPRLRYHFRHLHAVRGAKSIDEVAAEEPSRERAVTHARSAH